MATCGVWMTAQRLIAVAADDDGSVLAADRCRRCDDARWNMVSRLEGHLGLDCRLVVSQTLLAADALPRIAARRGARVLVAPDALVPAGTRLAGFARASPRTLALLLARMPLSAPFADRLMRLELQLPLL